jgi:hypothetical protein
MANFKLTEQQFVSVRNILGSILISFEEIERCSALHKSLTRPASSVNGFVELDLAKEDIDLLHAMLQEGTIKIREIPAALEIIRALTPQVNVGTPLYEHQD